MKKRAFWKTSEFWGLVVPWILGLVDAIGLVDLIPGSLDNKIWALVLSAATALGYGMIRINRKGAEDLAESHAEALSKANPI